MNERDAVDLGEIQHLFWVNRNEIRRRCPKNLPSRYVASGKAGRMRFVWRHCHFYAINWNNHTCCVPLFERQNETAKGKKIRKKKKPNRTGICNLYSLKKVSDIFLLGEVIYTHAAFGCIFGHFEIKRKTALWMVINKILPLWRGFSILKGGVYLLIASVNENCGCSFFVRVFKKTSHKNMTKHRIKTSNKNNKEHFH